MKKSKPYKLPEGYFDAMQSKVESQVSLPSLDKSPFEVPTDYWETMQQQVIKSFSNEAKVKSLWSRYWVGVAASVLVVICGAFWLGPNTVDTPSFADEMLLEQELLEAVDDELTLDQLAELVTMEDINDMQSDDDYIDEYEDLNIYELQEMF